MTGKEKRHLRALSNSLPLSATLGKGEMDEGILKAVDEALTAHELIKIRLLNNHDTSIEEEAKALSVSLGAEVVQILGHVITLYRYSEKKKVHLLS